MPLAQAMEVVPREPAAELARHEQALDKKADEHLRTMTQQLLQSTEV